MLCVSIVILIGCLGDKLMTSAVSDVHVPNKSAIKDILKSNWCTIWPDMRVPVGTTWKERCRKCECVGNHHTVCSGGPQCKNPYKPYHDDFCGKWSEDNCCCEDIGCYKYGKTIPFGEVYNDPPNDFCTKCLCLGYKEPTCWKKFCENIVCVDEEPTPGECCPRCNNGPNCSIPKLKGVDRALVDTSPLLLTRSRKIAINNDSYFMCRCMIPGADAFCVPGGQGGPKSPRFG